MPDQTPVTDDDRRTAYERAASLDPDMRCWTDRERAAARVILATVPAPPATLADEIREEGAGRPPGAVKRVNALADRVEAVEKENRAALNHAYDERDEALVERDEARTKVEEVEGHLSKSWRQRDAKDVELERLSREREQQEKALVEHGRLLAEARAAFDEVENRNLNLEADLRESHAEVERLTASLNRQCTTVTPSVHNTDGLTVSSDALPDPADVPTNEPWEVVGPNGPAIGYRDGHEDLPWSVVHKDGNGCDDLSDGRVTLVARLVRRLVGPVEVVEE
ncbi:hypothetical protein ACT3TD_13760 [Corynebacterium sp. AOP36-E1-14]|uniref:hypothetical protein n=1 Tax=Corynebacterium sp. AOP36-E1-14 TaxID=3457682 RepID=UPI0040335202